VLYKWVLQAIAKLLRHSPKKIGFPSENMLLKINAKLKCISDPPHYQIHNIIDKNGEGRCVLTMRMSEVTVNIVS